MTTEIKKRPDEVLIIAIYHFIEAAMLLFGFWPAGGCHLFAAEG